LSSQNRLSPRYAFHSGPDILKFQSKQSGQKKSYRYCTGGKDIYKQRILSLH